MQLLDFIEPRIIITVSAVFIAVCFIVFHLSDEQRRKIDNFANSTGHYSVFYLVSFLFFLSFLMLTDKVSPLQDCLDDYGLMLVLGMPITGMLINITNQLLVSKLIGIKTPDNFADVKDDYRRIMFYLDST